MDVLGNEKQAQAEKPISFCIRILVARPAISYRIPPSIRGVPVGVSRRFRHCFFDSLIGFLTDISSGFSVIGVQNNGLHL